MAKLIAWAELLDVAGWCIALKRPDTGGLWLSALAEKDLQGSVDIPEKWMDLLEPLNRVPATRMARKSDGLAIWSPKAAAPLPQQHYGLTQRESEVLSWLREGKTTPEIAIILGCAVRTVEKHLANLYRKLGARNRASAILTLSNLNN